MPNKQYARGIVAGFSPTENPFASPGGMEANLRTIDDLLGFYTATPPTAPGTPRPGSPVEGQGQIYLDGTFDVFNAGAWKRYPARQGVKAVQLDGQDVWLAGPSGWVSMRQNADLDVAKLAAGIYPDTATGIAATTNGKYFSVPSPLSTEFLILYKNNAGVALEVKRYPSQVEIGGLADATAAVAASAAAAADSASEASDARDAAVAAVASIGDSITAAAVAQDARDDAIAARDAAANSAAVVAGGVATVQTAVATGVTTVNTATSAGVTAVNAAAAAGVTQVNNVVGPAASSAAEAGVYANSASTSANAAAALAGISGRYATYAEANSAVGAIAANAYVIVTQDENYTGQSSYYQKVSGVLTYRGPAGISAKLSTGAHAFLNHPRGSVVCHVGDSNTVARPDYRAAYEPGWFGKGGIFEGWISYNLGANGTTAGSWVAAIATGDQNEGPADYVAGGPRGGQPWQVINAKPDVIPLSLGTNDFRVGAGPTNLAAKTAQFRADMATLINFFLARTNASIILRLPQPLVYRNPDPDGYTDCVSADDAAARSAAMRAVYLEWINASDRVKVVDLHKHLFGYRIDSLAASVDPETGGAMMSDSLHPNALGYVREVQVIARTINPNLPFTAAYNALPSTIFKQAAWARTVFLTFSGNNFFDVESDPQTFGVTSGQASGVRGPLNNIRDMNLLGRAGVTTPYFEFDQLGEVYAYFHSDGTTVGPFSIYSGTDFPLNGWRRYLTSTAAFGGRTGACTIYALKASAHPVAGLVGRVRPITVQLGGAVPLTVGAVGGLMHGYNLFQAFTVGGAAGWREGTAGSATVEVYISNLVTGVYNDGVRAAGAPGLRLGSYSWANGFRFAGTWTPDVVNWPVGTYPNGPTIPLSINVSITAVCTAGALGSACSLTLMPN